MTLELTTELCAWCGHPLVSVGFHQHARLQCDNWQCPAYRESQGIIPRPVEAPEKRHAPPRALRPSYRAYLFRRRENYRRLREAGINSREAAAMTSDKQTEFALAMLGAP